MYQILCDGNAIYDPRDDELIVNNPKCKLETNTIGEASFSIYSNHPYYEKMEKLRSIFEIKQDGETIFKGRMVDDSKNFNNVKVVDIEGLMGYFNDSVIKPFSFPEDFLEDADYIAASESGNVVEFFFKWIIEYHNSRVLDFQCFKVGTVTVSDPNNYISRSSEDYMSAWEVLKTKLFNSSLGGYLCIRYEEDGNYIDYLEDFVATNKQKIKFGENLLDISTESDASTIYTILIPLGARKSEIDPDSKDTTRLTVEEVADADITDDIVKAYDYIWSRSAVEKYGIIHAPVSDTTWEDVTDVRNLLQKGIEYLKNTASKLSNTITIKAVDLYYSDEDIESFRIYRYVDVESSPHNLEDRYRLTSLEIDLQNPQNTVITLGDTQLSMTDINANTKKESAERIETVIKDSGLKEMSQDVLDLEIALEEVNNTLGLLSKRVSEVNISLQEIEDSLNNEWVALELDDAFVAYEENQPMYKVTGNVVEVKGCFSPETEFISSTEKTVFARGIPEELCPSSIRSFICQGSGMNRWLLTVETDGSLTISRYGVSECVAVPTTEGLLFNGTYTIKKKGTE